MGMTDPRDEVILKREALESDIGKREAKLESLQKKLDQVNKSDNRVAPVRHKRKLLFISLAVAILVLFLLWFVSMVLSNLERVRSGTTVESFLSGNDGTQTLLPGAVVGTNSAQGEAVETDDDPQVGPHDALLTIVEFSDFQCPFCKDAFPIIKDLLASHGDKIRFIYRDFPVQSLHPLAQTAAEAGECAHAQGKFFPYHDKLFINQDSLTSNSFVAFAQELNMDVAAFSTCLTKHTFTQEVNQDYSAGVTAGVTGTPTFFVNGRRVPGVIPRDIWEKIYQSVVAPNGS